MENFQIIPSHAVGAWLLGLTHSILDVFGLQHRPPFEETVYVSLVIVFSLAIGWILKKAIIWAVRKFVKMSNNVGATELLQQKVITRCGHIIPPLVFLGLVPFAFTSGHKLLVFIERAVGAYTMVALGIGLSAIARFLFTRYVERQNTKGLPLKGILNISLGIIWIVMAILSISIIVDRSPAYLLTGLGAFAAALMLIFKDSILGFTAGIQMSQNDMLHVGDWIVVPGTPANGTVMDVTLSAVKIQNFDNTIVTVPPYTLVSTSFQNYRGMKMSGMRRFTRTFVIDVTSIVRLTPDIISGIVAKYPEIKKFVDTVDASENASSMIAANPGLRPVNGTVETTLGLFRAYCTQYLLASPWINKDSQILVRILDPIDNGIPLDIYAFTATTDWTQFEAIQSGIMEHIAMAINDFGLTIFNTGAYDITMVPDTPAGPKKIETRPA